MAEDSSGKFVTVMCTGFHAPARSAGQGGNAPRALLERVQSSIVRPAVEENRGEFAKSGGAGILSYFENALDAVCAAARIQKEMDALNLSERIKFPVLLRIGLHSGNCVLKGNEVFGDAAEGAGRIEEEADAGGVLMSEETWNALSGKSEIYCRFVKQVMLNDRQEPCNAYKAFWNPQEIELDVQGRTALPRQEYGGPVRSSGMKLLWGVLAMIGIVLLLTLGTKFFGAARGGDSARSISDTGNSASTRDALR